MKFSRRAGQPDIGADGPLRTQCQAVSESNTSERYPAESRRDVVALPRPSGRTVTVVARELGVSPKSLRNRVRQDDTGRDENPAGALTSSEKNERRRLRRQNREQGLERGGLTAA
ncbi:transposase [Streptomyces marianii]|uniref:transposase n=1 Tax=Streptomyces marianii TaxID=1817406 RepID=UPI0022792DB3|nr:transposase [Streptomyces marianii]